MSPYYNELPTTMDEEMLTTFLLIFLGVMGVVLLVALVFWIIRSLSLMALAKRRGIRNAWLAWIPVGSEWVLGSVSDQYQHLVQNKITSRRKILLALEIASLVVVLGTYAVAIFQAVAAVTEEEMVAASLLSAIPSLLSTGVGITTMVFYHMSNYDLYRSCNPRNAVAFLVLGIIFPVCEPFFYLACRKKDLGMIVPEVEVAEPAELPQATPEF